MTDPQGKDAARRRARAVRDGIADPTTRDRCAAVVSERIAELDLPPGVVGGYWPLGSELDVRPALLHLKNRGRGVALPVSGPRGTALEFRDWDAGEEPVLGRYGIMEPAAGRTVVHPAVLLVPLLAFDRTGHRLGYGAGYYDRTLDALRAAGPVLAVGVAFAAQEIVAVPCADHDQRLDWIVTERETLRIGG